MSSFLLGMLVMYLIVGILAIISETFGGGFLDGWFFYLFAWWAVVLVAPIGLIKRLKKSKKSIDK